MQRHAVGSLVNKSHFVEVIPEKNKLEQGSENHEITCEWYETDEKQQ